MAKGRLTPRTAIVAVIGLGLVAWAGVTLLMPPSQPTLTTAQGVSSGGPVEVEVAEVGVGDARTVHRSTGEIVRADAMPVPSPMGGSIDAIEVADGAEVAEGDVLVRLQQTAQSASLMSAEALLDQAEAVLERAREVSGTDLATHVDEAELEQDVETARRDLEAARDAVEAHNIRAPFAGTVRLLDLAPGSTLVRGDPVIEISTEERLLVRFDVPRDLAAAVQPGTEVEVETEAGANLPAVVEADRAGGAAGVGETLTLEAVLGEIAEGVGLGDRVEVVVPVARVEPSAVVPPTALHDGPTGSVVYRVTDGIARAVPVQTGAVSEVGVEVFGALQPGDRVVVSNLDELVDGVRVAER